MRYRIRAIAPHGSQANRGPRLTLLSQPGAATVQAIQAIAMSAVTAAGFSRHSRTGAKLRRCSMQ
ncbi:hypothetical protein, partial [Enterobacter hormaechei]|uniref:hypothetical protein n=1 Tax=Enterobacter hormaechei TaxID=158836 RepID=UPI00204153E2